MRLLLCASDVVGLPVVTISGGDDVAEVRDVVYDPEAGRVVGLTLNKRGFLSGRHRQVLPAAAIAAIGQDAIMVADASDLVAPEAAPGPVGHPPKGRNVVGNDVLAEGGVSLGRVRDLLADDGEVVGYQIDRTPDGVAYIPLPAQLAISGHALVVPDATEAFVRDDLSGFGAAVDEFRALLGLR